MSPELIAAARRLAQVLELENAALAKMDFARAATVLAEKQTLTEQFNQADAKGATQSPMPTSADTLAVARQLQRLAKENRALLEQAMDVQSTVIGCIRKAAMRPTADRRYGAKGNATSSRPAPMALTSRA
jgi:hypothetical protein